MCNCRKNKTNIDSGTAAAQQLTDQQISELVASAQDIATRVERRPITPSLNTATL